MIDWFILTVFVTLAWAVQSFLYKEGVRRKVEPFSMMFWMELPGMLACFIFLLATGGLVWHTLVFALAAVSGFLFAGRTYLRMEALKHLPLNVLYPILSFDVVLTVLASLWILKEHLGFYQILGLIIVLFVLFSYYREHRAGKQKKGFKTGLVLALVVIVLSTIAALVNKFGAVSQNLNMFLLMSYVFTTVFSGIGMGLRGSSFNKQIPFGLIMGVINLLTYIPLIWALSKGPLSIISPVVATSVLFASLLAWVFHKEKLTVKRVVLIILSIAAVALMRL